VPESKGSRDASFPCTDSSQKVAQEVMPYFKVFRIQRAGLFCDFWGRMFNVGWPMGDESLFVGLGLGHCLKSQMTHLCH